VREIRTLRSTRRGWRRTDGGAREVLPEETGSNGKDSPSGEPRRPRPYLRVREERKLKAPFCRPRVQMSGFPGSIGHGPAPAGEPEEVRRGVPAHGTRTPRGSRRLPPAKGLPQPGDTTCCTSARALRDFRNSTRARVRNAAESPR
jgi:hypothetical protein